MVEMATVRERARQAAQKAKGTIQERAEAIREKAQAPGLGIPAFYIGVTAASVLASIILFSRKEKETAIFVGLWPPTILALGLFHRLVVGQKSE